MRRRRRPRPLGALLAVIEGTIPEGDFSIHIYEHGSVYLTPVGCFTRRR